MTSAYHSYRIRLRGVASDILRAAFDDVQVSQRAGQTVLTTGPLDAAALYGLISRIESLGLVLMDVEVIDAGRPGDSAAS